jgi:hypothetical protein
MLPQNTERGSKKQVQFRLHPTKQIVGSMDGPRISGLGGLVLLGELENSIGLVQKTAAALVDWRAKYQYSLYLLLLQRVLLICAGLEDGIDSNYHRHDPAVLTALGLNVSTDCLASQPTVSLFETRMGSRNCYRIAKALLEFYISTRGSVPKEIILDPDGSSFPVHGNQQHSSYRGHYETDMYFPLLIFDQDGWLITAILRPGGEGEARMLLPVLKRIVPAFRKAWPNVRILVRADAGFNSPALYDWCEDQGKDDPAKTVHYLIRLKAGPRANGAHACVKDQATQIKRSFHRSFGSAKYPDPGDTQQRHADFTELLTLPKKMRSKKLTEWHSRKKRGFCDFFYSAGMGKKKWRHDRRIIGILDYTDTGPEQSFLVTNIKDQPPNWLYEQRYCQRGKAETFIHELKSLYATRLSCSDFWANQFRLFEHAIAYLLLFKLRELLPPDAKKMSLGSVRDNFIKVAVLVRDSAKKVILQWTSHYFWQRQFLFLCNQLERLPAPA